MPVEGADASELKRWFSDESDVRDDIDITTAIQTFIEQHGAKTVVVADRIIGCPRMTILAIDHVQLAMPPGAEPYARAFYGQVLGLWEIPKPPPLADRGGVWFGNDAVQIHLGVEADFRPARKAHPALRVDDLDALEAVVRAAGFEPERDTGLPGYARFYVADPFGNRLEFLQPEPSHAPAA